MRRELCRERKAEHTRSLRHSSEASLWPENCRVAQELPQLQREVYFVDFVQIDEWSHTLEAGQRSGKRVADNLAHQNEITHQRSEEDHLVRQRQLLTKIGLSGMFQRPPVEVY